MGGGGGGLLMTENLNDNYGEWNGNGLHPSRCWCEGRREENWESFEVWLFWYWNVWVGSLRPPPPSSPSTPQLRQVSPGLPSAVLKTDSTDWNILNYCRCVSILFRKYISILFCKKHSDYNTASILSTYLDTTTIPVSISISEQKIFWKFIVM